MTKKISIVVPVYNGEKYIRHCLDSILGQSNFDLADLEILLINDGSSDNSRKILKKYSMLYPSTVKLINQENIGAANTRNKGIQLATGTYVMFIDQDDTVESDYCETFYNAAEKGKYDVVRGGFKLVDGQGKVHKYKMPVETEFGKFLSVPAWAKIHRTQFLRENMIEFFNNNIGEDNVFVVNEIISTNHWGTIPYAGYNNAFENSDNVTNTFHKGLSEKVAIVSLLDKMLTIRSNDKLTDEMIIYNIVRTISYYLLSYGHNATYERFMSVYQELFAWMQKKIPDYNKNRYIRFTAPSGEAISASVGIRGLILLHKLHLVKYFARLYCRG